jgi:hypothetical protein
MKKSNLWIDKWGESRFYALYDGNDLVCVTAYKRGAESVKRRVEALEERIEQLEQVKGEQK